MTTRSARIERQASAVASRTRWDASRVFMAASAIWHLPLGVIGLLIDQTFPLSSAEAAAGHSEHIFGVFETNGWHSLAALLLGIVSTFFLIRPTRAREAALAIGVAHVGFVLALVVWAPSTFLIASNMADQFVHASTAATALLAGVLTPRTHVGSDETDGLDRAPASPDGPRLVL